MPLNGHTFLVNQGWSGTGTGLREGAISRPITASQKKNLSGIGKDRDEAFPFWDHLFTVAASAIQIECFSSDDDDEDRTESGIKVTRSSTLELRQTSTGILCNRSPIAGTPASSGASTPTPCQESTPSSSVPRPSLLSLAKRETARRGLYSRFFRGPVLGPDDIQDEMVKTEPPITTSHIPSRPGDTEKGTKKEGKTDACEEDTPRELTDKEEQKREKRLRKEAKKAARKAKRHKEKRHKAEDDDVSNTKHADERIPSPSQEQPSDLLISTTPDETPRVRGEKKKKKRPKVSLIDDELDAQPPILTTDKRTRKDSSNFSRKRHRRD